jgi:hypothetical protein
MRIQSLMTLVFESNIVKAGGYAVGLARHAAQRDISSSLSQIANGSRQQVVKRWKRL